MKKILIIIILTPLIVVATSYKIGRRVYFHLSRHVLKPYFGIETPIYRKWHNRRARKLQLALDAEHNF